MMKGPLIYLQVLHGEVLARRVGGATLRRSCDALAHPRTLMGDFTAVEACFRALLSELGSQGLLAIAPRVLVHLMPEADGGYTDVELRAFDEAARSAGARQCVVVTGGAPRPDDDIARAFG